MTKFTSRDYKMFAALLALDAAVLAGATMWALVDALIGGGPASAWWWVAGGVAATSGTAAGALRCYMRAAQVGMGGDA
jgi:hypothetical protein